MLSFLLSYDILKLQRYLVMEVMLKELYKKEEEIKELYLGLIEAEENNDEEAYEYFIQQINKATKIEAMLISKLLIKHDVVEIINKINMDDSHQEENPISLSTLKKAYLFRMISLLKTIDGRELTTYVNALKLDTNRLVIGMISKLINNPFYQDIRSLLIKYKNNLIYMHDGLEYDLICGKINDTKIVLNHEREAILDYEYIDKGILVSEAIELLIEVSNEYSKDNDSLEHRFLAIIKIISALSRLTLCDEKYSNLGMFILSEIENSEKVDDETKNIIKEMQEVLCSIHNNISRARK